MYIIKMAKSKYRSRRNNRSKRNNRSRRNRGIKPRSKRSKMNRSSNRKGRKSANRVRKYSRGGGRHHLALTNEYHTLEEVDASLTRIRKMIADAESDSILRYYAVGPLLAVETELANRVNTGKQWGQKQKQEQKQEQKQKQGQAVRPANAMSAERQAYRQKRNERISHAVRARNARIGALTKQGYQETNVRAAVLAEENGEVTSAEDQLQKLEAERIGETVEGHRQTNTY